jgi:hypothetical protein
MGIPGRLETQLRGVSEGIEAGRIEYLYDPELAISR